MKSAQLIGIFGVALIAVAGLVIYFMHGKKAVLSSRKVHMIYLIPLSILTVIILIASRSLHGLYEGLEKDRKAMAVLIQEKNDSLLVTTRQLRTMTAEKEELQNDLFAVGESLNSLMQENSISRDSILKLNAAYITISEKLDAKELEIVNKGIQYSGEVDSLQAAIRGMNSNSKVYSLMLTDALKKKDSLVRENVNLNKKILVQGYYIKGMQAQIKGDDADRPKEKYRKYNSALMYYRRAEVSDNDPNVRRVTNFIRDHPQLASNDPD